MNFKLYQIILKKIKQNSFYQNELKKKTKLIYDKQFKKLKIFNFLVVSLTH